MAFLKASELSTQMTVTDAFRTALESELNQLQQRTASFMEWSKKVPEPRGPLNFERWPCQRELYELGFSDEELTIQKATQVGVSAFLVRWALCWADLHAARVLYIFPRERQLLDFSDSRVRPLILGQYLKDRVPPMSVQNKSLKEVGLGIVYFRGSEAEAGLESIDADAIALDEYDLLVQKHIPVVERRIGASELGLIRRVGFPTIEDTGINAEYKKTDMRQWFVRCDCGTRQTVTWKDNVDVERVLRVCKDCRKPLDVSKGEWVAEQPDRAVKGYHVTKLIMPSTNLQRMVDASQQREEYKRQIFVNRDLGEPWSGEGNRLTPRLIAACQRQGLLQEGGYSGNNLVLMGVDVASVRSLNVWISERLDDTTGRTLFIGEADSFDEVGKLMERYKVHMAAVDHLPEGRLSRALADKFRGRVFVVNYATASQKLVLDPDLEQSTVSVRRTEALDSIAERIRSQRELLPMDLPDDFVKQMCANVRSHERDDVGRVSVVWRTVADSADDYMQAGSYLVVANECYYLSQEVENSEEITAIDEMEGLGFERSSVNDPDDDGVYSPGPSDGEYGFDPSRMY